MYVTMHSRRASLGGKHISSSHLPPMPVDFSAPSYADTGYKLVALVKGIPTSIYDGITQYPVGQTVMQTLLTGQRSGLYVFTHVRECLQQDAQVFPKNSQLLDYPRAIAKVKAWNLDRSQPPVRYGTKRAYSCVRVVELLPVPATFRLAGAAADESLQSRRRELHRECSCPHVSASHWDGCLHHRLERGRSSLRRAHVSTVQLEEQVGRLERQMAAMRADAPVAAINNY